MTLISDYEVALHDGEEWCPKCDTHYLPPWDYCRCVETTNKLNIDKALNKKDKQFNKPGDKRGRRK